MANDASAPSTEALVAEALAAEALAAEAPTTSETIELLLDRRSVRKIAPDPIGRAQIEAVLKAAFRAPTSSNIQAYSVVVVRDAEIRKALSVPTGNQRHIAEAPVFLAFCADLTRIEHALEKHGHALDDNVFEVGLVSSIDATLVGMSAYLAADSLGLKGVLIGAVRNDPVAIAKILGLPKRVYCVFGMCLGRPAALPEQKPRMDYRAMVHEERYDRDKMKDLLETYDPVLAQHYRENGRETTDDSWTHDMDKKFHPYLRGGLRDALRELGFDFR